MYTVSSFFQSRIGEGVAATNFNMGSALHKNLYALCVRCDQCCYKPQQCLFVQAAAAVEECDLASPTACAKAIAVAQATRRRCATEA